jgi:hypothetical protein
MDNQPESITEALESIEAAVTICDADLKLLYMNEKTASGYGGAKAAPKPGYDLSACHKPKSVAKMREILSSGAPNVYTITKKGMKKLIWQGPWKMEGKVAGLVEISIVLPPSMPHFDRG